MAREHSHEGHAHALRALVADVGHNPEDGGGSTRQRKPFHKSGDTELSLPGLLWWRKTARIAPFIALGLHASIELCAHPDLLGWEMSALLLCLWPSAATSNQRVPVTVK